MNARQPWSACPNCFRDLASKPIGSKPPHTFCSYCKVPPLPVWWQRVIWAIVATAFSFIIPFFLGIKGLALLFTALICWAPVFVLTGIWVFKIVPPKYARKTEAVMSLLHK